MSTSTAPQSGPPPEDLPPPAPPLPAPLPPDASSGPREHTARIALRQRAFRLMLVMQLANTCAQITLFVVQAWYVNAAAPDGRAPVYLGLMGALRGVIFLGYVSFGGSLADRFPRRQVLFASQSVALVLILLIGFRLSTTGTAEADRAALVVTILLFSTFGLIQGQDRPTRTAMVRDSVPPEARTSAITMFQLMSGIANLIAAPLALMAVDRLGIGTTYLLASLGPAIVITLATRLPPSAPADPDARGASVLRNIGEGLALVRSEHAVRWAILLTWSSTAIGMSLVAMLIVTWATDVLELSASSWGIMEIFWGGGSLAGSILLTLRSNPRRKGALFLLSSTLLGCGALALSLTRAIPLAFMAYGVSALGFALMNTLGVAIVQEVVPNRLMGRVTGLLLIGGGLMQVATLPIGLLVALVGIEATFTAGSGLLLAITALVAWRQPTLRRLD